MELVFELFRGTCSSASCCDSFLYIFFRVLSLPCSMSLAIAIPPYLSFALYDIRIRYTYYIYTIYMVYISELASCACSFRTVQVRDNKNKNKKITNLDNAKMQVLRNIACCNHSAYKCLIILLYIICLLNVHWTIAMLRSKNKNKKCQLYKNARSCRRIVYYTVEVLQWTKIKQPVIVFI